MCVFIFYFLLIVSVSLLPIWWTSISRSTLLTTVYTIHSTRLLSSTPGHRTHLIRRPPFTLSVRKVLLPSVLVYISPSFRTTPDSCVPLQVPRPRLPTTPFLPPSPVTTFSRSLRYNDGQYRKNPYTRRRTRRNQDYVFLFLWLGCTLSDV